jgi:hypothetical protein
VPVSLPEEDVLPTEPTPEPEAESIIPVAETQSNGATLPQRRTLLRR